MDAYKDKTLLAMKALAEEYGLQYMNTDSGSQPISTVLFVKHKYGLCDASLLLFIDWGTATFVINGFCTSGIPLVKWQNYVPTLCDLISSFGD